MEDSQRIMELRYVLGNCLFRKMNLPRSLSRAFHVLLLTGAVLFLCLHFVHLTADFPNNSPWMDWSKYTDEGWYGDGAIRHFQLGHWYVTGDFNPAAALPVWPFLEALVFAFTGVSLAAARALTVAVFAGILIASWFLVAGRASGASGALRAPSPTLAASIAVLLLAVSPFCFVFTRIAITEPLLILLTLLALLAARRVRQTNSVPHISFLKCGLDAARANLLPILALGLLLPLMVLTKTTALFLVPAVFWMLLAASGYRISAFLRVAIPIAFLGGCLWLLYFLALVRPHFLTDFRYLFSANDYTGITRQNWLIVLSNMLRDGRWMGALLYPLTLAAAAVALLRPRSLTACPLIPALLLWIAGYMAFLAYHNNLQPRYYLVVAVPLTLLLPVVVQALVLPQLRAPAGRLLAFALSALAVLAIAIPAGSETLNFVRHPEYSLLNAARDVAATIAQDRKSDPAHNPLILSISGSEISLMTGLPSICDDFGTLELVDRVRKYRPGWYVAWNQVEDDKLDAIWPLFRMERVAAFPAMDDPDRNLLILYKLVPATLAPAPPARRRGRTPRAPAHPRGSASRAATSLSTEPISCLARHLTGLSGRRRIIVERLVHQHLHRDRLPILHPRTKAVIVPPSPPPAHPAHSPAVV